MRGYGDQVSKGYSTKLACEKDKYLFTMIFTYVMALCFTLYAWFNSRPSNISHDLELLVGNMSSTTMTVAGVILIENMVEMMRVATQKIRFNLLLLCALLPFAIIYVLYKENISSVVLCCTCSALVLITNWLISKAYSEVSKNRSPDGNNRSINR